MAKACAKHCYHSSSTAKLSFCRAALPGPEAGVVFGQCREHQDQDKLPEDLGKDVKRQKKKKILWVRGVFDCSLSEEMARGWGVWPLFPVLLFYPSHPSTDQESLVPQLLLPLATCCPWQLSCHDACAFLTSVKGRASARATSPGADISLLSQLLHPLLLFNPAGNL